MGPPKPSPHEQREPLVERGDVACRRRSKNVAPGKNRRGGRIAERTFVQTLGPEQNGDFPPFSQEAVRHRSVRRHGDVE